MKVDSRHYAGRRFAFYCNHPLQIPAEARETVTGPYAELVRFHVMKTLGLYPEPTTEINLLAGDAAAGGVMPGLMVAARKMAETIQDDFSVHTRESRLMKEALPRYRPTRQDFDDLETVDAFLSRGRRPYERL